MKVRAKEHVCHQKLINKSKANKFWHFPLLQSISSVLSPLADVPSTSALLPFPRLCWLALLQEIKFPKIIHAIYI